MRRNSVDEADIQGLLRFSYKRMTQARFQLLRIKDAAAARAWLRSADVTTAAFLPRDQRPSTALQIAFTTGGLRALGLPESVIEGFSHEFRTGMATEHRSRLLGDVGANGPGEWTWGGPGDEPDVLAMFYGTADRLDEFVKGATGEDWTAGFEELDALDSRLDGVEPFGFVDGISQPGIDWAQDRDTPTSQVDYANLVALGEFLLGYPNEYGKITDRPLLDPDDRNAQLPAALDAPEKKDLGRNGTYLVLRQLSQDVRGFWQFVTAEAGGDPAGAEKLAEAMVGRRVNGEPLVPRRDEPIPGIESEKNQFTFDEDQSGARCPFGSHIRRANPRNPDFPGRPTSLLKKIIIMLGFGPRGFRDDLMSSVRFHRVLRRGRKYGPDVSRADAQRPAPSGEAQPGLLFIGLNANISRQFEFVQNAWMSSTKFSGLSGESDPLLGNREAIPGCPVTSDFNLQQEGGLRRRVAGLPQFTTVRGGGYFFLPGLRALRYIAGRATP